MRGAPGMYAFVIGEAERVAIRELREWASANPVRITADMPKRGAVFDAPRQIAIPFGYTVSYTVEIQPHGTIRHLAVSLARDSDPHPGAVQLLMDEFGFINPLGRAVVWATEGTSPRVVNVIEPLDGDIDRFRRPDPDPEGAGHG